MLTALETAGLAGGRASGAGLLGGRDAESGSCGSGSTHSRFSGVAGRVSSAGKAKLAHLRRGPSASGIQAERTYSGALYSSLSDQGGVGGRSEGMS